MRINKKQRFFTILLIGAFVVGCSAMGTNSKKQKREGFKNSQNYDTKSEKFLNRRAEVIDAMWKRNFTVKNFVEFFKERRGSAPSHPLPFVQPDVSSFVKSKEGMKVIWFGHSTFLLNVEGQMILVDPVFSESASPVSFFIKRFQEPVLSLDELPKLDFVLISHDHYDHLDMESIQFLSKSKAKFITPLGVGSHLEGWGVKSEQIVERDWWQDIEFDGLKFIATPAQHFSGRGLLDGNKTLWASWIIQSQSQKIYFSGDSGYDTHFKDIGEKYGPFDVAFLETGQYDKKWREVHMLPEEAVVAFKDLKAKKYFPIHWGMFILAFHSWNDPMVQLFKLAEANNIEVVAPKIGEVVDFNKKFENELWWQD